MTGEKRLELLAGSADQPITAPGTITATQFLKQYLFIFSRSFLPCLSSSLPSTSSARPPSRCPSHVLHPLVLCPSHFLHSQSSEEGASLSFLSNLDCCGVLICLMAILVQTLDSRHFEECAITAVQVQISYMLPVLTHCRPQTQSLHWHQIASPLLCRSCATPPYNTFPPANVF